MFSFLKNENEEAKRNNQPFKIKEVVDASYKPEPDDTENVKRSLNKLGYYNPPQGEFTKFTETSMYDGIKNLQKEHKLTVDGRINPEGETMKKMNELLGKKEEKTVVNTNDNYSKKFDTLLRNVKNKEGRIYEDRPNKIDQKTHTGITQPTLERFHRAHPDLSGQYPKNVKDLSQEQIDRIYKKDYYDAYRINEIKHPKISETIFDSFVNHSPQGPAIWTQEGINKYSKQKIKVDGKMGSRTINTLNQLTDEEVKNINNYIVDKRIENINKQPIDKQRSYSKGWNNRFKQFYME